MDAIFITGIDNALYKKLKDDLANQYTLGSSKYPKMLDAVVSMLMNYKLPQKPSCVEVKQKNKRWHLFKQMRPLPMEATGAKQLDAASANTSTLPLIQ